MKPSPGKFRPDGVSSPAKISEENSLEAQLRPQNLEEFVGQRALKSNLRVFIEAARKRKEPLDHCLFCAPPGLGKTTLAHIIAREMNVGLRCTSGPALERVGDLAAILSNLSDGDVFFVDEIHRLNRLVEEALYPAMEEYRLDIVLGKGASAATMRYPLPRFTLVGATTRTALLTGPLRERFGIIGNLEFYSLEDLEKILNRSGKILSVQADAESGREIASRSRGTPRIANRLLKRVRDFAQVRGDGKIRLELAREALEALQIDSAGLDPMDRRILKAVMEKFGGGPVGIETLAVAVSEEPDTLAEVYEPFLIQSGFLERSPKGRLATEHAYRHLGVGLKNARRAAAAPELPIEP